MHQNRSKTRQHWTGLHTELMRVQRRWTDNGASEGDRDPNALAEPEGTGHGTVNAAHEVAGTT